jgi:hypothetical protein
MGERAQQQGRGNNGGSVRNRGGLAGRGGLAAEGHSVRLSMRPDAVSVRTSSTAPVNACSSSNCAAYAAPRPCESRWRDEASLACGIRLRSEALEGARAKMALRRARATRACVRRVCMHAGGWGRSGARRQTDGRPPGRGARCRPAARAGPCRRPREHTWSRWPRARRRRIQRLPHTRHVHAPAEYRGVAGWTWRVHALAGVGRRARDAAELRGAAAARTLPVWAQRRVCRPRQRDVVPAAAARVGVRLGHVEDARRRGAEELHVRGPVHHYSAHARVRTLD